MSFCTRKPILKVYVCMARRMHGGWDQGCRVSNLSEQIRIRVFGVIHIHTGEGIGVGLFFGLFSVPVLTLLCAQTHKEHTSSHVKS